MWRQEYDALRQEFESFKQRTNGSPGSAGKASSRYLLPEVDQEVVLSLKTTISELQVKKYK